MISNIYYWLEIEGRKPSKKYKFSEGFLTMTSNIQELENFLIQGNDLLLNEQHLTYDGGILSKSNIIFHIISLSALSKTQ